MQSCYWVIFDDSERLRRSSFEIEFRTFVRSRLFYNIVLNNEKFNGYLHEIKVFTKKQLKFYWNYTIFLTFCLHSITKLYFRSFPRIFTLIFATKIFDIFYGFFFLVSYKPVNSSSHEVALEIRITSDRAISDVFVRGSCDSERYMTTWEKSRMGLATFLWGNWFGVNTHSVGVLVLSTYTVIALR